jgi:hypothetical protein
VFSAGANSDDTATIYCNGGSGRGHHSGIDTVIRQLEPASVAQHVRMRFDIEACGIGRTVAARVRLAPGWMPFRRSAGPRRCKSNSRPVCEPKIELPNVFNLQFDGPLARATSKTQHFECLAEGRRNFSTEMTGGPYFKLSNRKGAA